MRGILKVMTKLVTNPNYGKIRPGSVMLKDMVRHMEFLSACSSCVGLAPLIKAKSILASCSDYTTVAFAVWRIMNTLPSMEVPAQRTIDAKEFKKELFAKEYIFTRKCELEKKTWIWLRHLGLRTAASHPSCQTSMSAPHSSP